MRPSRRCAQLVLCLIAVMSAHGTQLRLDPGVAEALHAIIQQEGQERQASAGPVSYVVTPAQYDQGRLLHMAEYFGLDDGARSVARNGGVYIRSGDHELRVGYNPRQGKYSYASRRIQRLPLVDTSEYARTALLSRAKTILDGLVTDASVQYRLANRETEWYQTKTDTTPRIHSVGFRFTRFLGERHVLGNVACCTITFAGNQEVASVELTDCQIAPKPVTRIVMAKEAMHRLEKYVEACAQRAADKHLVPLLEVAATKCLRTYSAHKMQGQTLLVPNISFVCEYDFGDGHPVSKFVNFSLDASVAEDIVPRMLEDKLVE